MTSLLRNIKNRITSRFRDQAFVDYAMIFVIGIFMLAVLWRDAHSSWAFTNKDGSVTDNYFIALNAKNISEGKGWGLHNGYEFVPFEREISTGPVVFLPVALMLNVVTDPDDARYLGVMLLDIALLLFLLMRLRIFFSKETYRGIYVLIPFVLLAFMREQWYLVLGEVAASLLLLISATYAAEQIIDCKKTSPQKIHTQKMLLSGLFAGMALMSKLITILCSPWIFLVLTACLITNPETKDGVRGVVKKVLPWLVGFCVVPGLVALWHLVVFNGNLSRLVEYSLDYLRYYFGLGWTGKMESTFCPDPDCLRANFYAAASSWPNRYGSILAGLSLSVPVLGFLLFFKKNKKPSDYLLILFAGMCAAQFLFFYFNGIHKQSRYYFIGGFIAVFTVVVLLSLSVNYFSSRHLKRGMMVILWLGILVVAQPLYRDQGLNTYHRDIRDVARYTNQHPVIDEMLWLSLGPEPLPFYTYYTDNQSWWSVYGLIGDKFRRSTEALQVDADFYWKNRRNYYVLQEKWQNNPSALSLCATEHFRNEHFRVLECSPAELEAFYVALSGGKMRFPQVTP